MSEELKKILARNIQSLFEGDYGFEDMEVAFGLEDKNDNLTDEEKNQFGDFEDADEVKSNYNSKDAYVQPALNKVHKDADKEATDYYKDVAKKMKSYQKPNQEATQSRIGEAIDAPKRNVEDSEEEMGLKAPTGTGMEGLRYDDEETENYKEFEKRVDDLNDDKEGTLYNKMKKAGERYKDYKYGDKYPESENEYQETPRVRTTKNETIMKYSDVIKENIFKTKGKIMSEEQVAKVAKKVPSRVKVDETVFAITDGDKYYRLIWEGAEDGEPIITHEKNKEVFNESIEKMKHLWSFNSKDTISTKKTVAENNEDVFKSMLDKMRGGLIKEEEEMCEECGSDYMEEEEELTPKQSKEMDTDKDGDIDGEDLSNLRKGKKDDVNEEEELNEFFGGRKRRKAELEADFKTKSRVWAAKGVIDQPTRTDFLEFMNAAEDDNYEGKTGLDKVNRKIVYRNADDINWRGLGLNRSGSFGGTGTGE
jgi:hypothetical protein